MADRWIRFHPDRFRRWRQNRSCDEILLLLLVGELVRSLDTDSNGEHLQQGQFVLTRSYVMEAFGWTERHSRTVIKNVQQSGQFAAIRVTNKGTVFSLLPDSVFSISLQKATSKTTTKATTIRESIRERHPDAPLSRTHHGASEKKKAAASVDEQEKQKGDVFDAWD